MNHHQFKAAQQLTKQGFTSKAAHSHLSLRVFWKQDGEVKSAVLCRKHRNTKYRSFPLCGILLNSPPADSCEYCAAEVGDD
jgi:hypothetical protein